ncbi:MAG: AMP-binding protein [Paracoccaceae bacterium]|nr:AMP-binding protein [Paracoccaceae bacterium]
MKKDGVLVFDGAESQFSDIKTAAARGAAGLHEIGVGPGDTVAILMRNSPAYLEAVLGIERITGMPVPLNCGLTEPEIRHILIDSEAVAFICDPEFLAVARAACSKRCQLVSSGAATDGLPGWTDWVVRMSPVPRAGAASFGRLSYTSGTTGRPKGVCRAPLSGESRAAFAGLIDDWFDLGPDVRSATLGPLYHSIQLTYAMAVLRAGGRLYLERGFDADRLLTLVDTKKLSHLNLVPTMMQRMLSLPAERRATADMGSLRFVIHGAAPCPPNTKRAFIDWIGPIVWEYYGSTEMGMISRSDSREWLERPGTLGRAWSGRRLQVRDDAGTVLAAGAVGEVFADFGPAPDFVYKNLPDTTQRARIGDFATNGDIGYLDEAGYLFLLDRREDLIVSGGVNIYPAEVEAALLDHPDIDDCAVVGLPDPDLGRITGAALVLRDAADLDDQSILSWLDQRLARFKHPRRFCRPVDWPRDANGKINRRALIDAF